MFHTAPRACGLALSTSTSLQFLRTQIPGPAEEDFLPSKRLNNIIGKRRGGHV
ncbi:hypothetical protein Cadr_000030950 [Camelus dromedarius]|uniref:Uncharacterized protein n=1 Tax=Camelus dromedarius TaxID=9838 RepID=A0A5N4BZN6_CAMDR|nr:hypothetical protein Cadr_000030950 [Camelus dromedarius]